MQQTPRDAWGSVKAPAFQIVLIKILFFCFRITGIWSKPYVHDPDVPDIRADLYYLFKTRFPVLKRGVGGYPFKPVSSKYSPGTDAQISSSNNCTESFVLTAVGDLMNSPGLRGSEKSFYSNVKSDLFNSDLSFANLESTMPAGEFKPLSFSAGEMPKVLIRKKEASILLGTEKDHFDIVNLVHNHCADEGIEGIHKTIDFLDNRGIIPLFDRSPEKVGGVPCIIEKNDLKIGFIAATYSLNSMSFDNNKPCVPVIPFHTLEYEGQLDLIEKQISYCKNQSCDIIIASLHWGMEFELYPKKEQQKFAGQLAGAGVDIILGHHSHMIQMVEFIKLSDQKTVPVIYGMGNLTDPFSSYHTALSLSVRSEFTVNGGTCRLKKLVLTPVVRWEIPNSEDGKKEENFILQIIPLSTLISDLRSNQHKFTLDEKNRINSMAVLTDMVLEPSWRD